MTLDTPISDLFGVGPAYVKRLHKLEIHSIKDLLHHFPSRHEDWSLITPIADIQAGERVTIQGQITQFQNLTTKRGKPIQTGQITDNSGSITITWFNQRYLSSVIRVGDSFNLSGKADLFNSRLSLTAPDFEKVTEDKPFVHTGRLVPIYPATAGLSSKWLRAKIKYVLDNIPTIQDWLPESITNDQPDKHADHLVSLDTALRQIHFPDSQTEFSRARYRLAFDEFLWLHLESLERRSTWQHQNTATKISTSWAQISPFIQSLPFKLTTAQLRSTKEILEDLNRSHPMNRLLEGDVGSGKTIVAAAAAYAAFLTGTQTAIMAPTEILANQHYQSISQLLTPLSAQVVLQTGRQKYIKKGKDAPFDIIIGTHALISDAVNFDNLGLVIIDEQHRFGVEQRTKLINKGTAPHVLNMTATPIPRTIALTVYGDLELSILDELPPGRQPVKTWLVPPNKRAPAYDWIQQQILTQDSTQSKQSQLSLQTDDIPKAQAFIVCPFVEPSESMATVKAAKQEFEKLQKLFTKLKLDLLHGKLSGKQKDQVIDRFRQGQTDILVTTPVVEVGVDIPQATIMMIEDADRFGLAQLHQLRGRVGRGSQASYCLLFTDSDNADTHHRLRAMETTTSGLQLAELDLKLRGPGELYGTNQHGFISLKIASYADTDLIKQTQKAAQKLYKQLNKYPDLRKQLQHRTIQPVQPN